MTTTAKNQKTRVATDFFGDPESTFNAEGETTDFFSQLTNDSNTRSRRADDHEPIETLEDVASSRKYSSRKKAKGELIMWDDLNGTMAMEDVEIPKNIAPKEDELGRRMDNFAVCLSNACGKSSINLVDAFHTTPPLDCVVYKDYIQFLKPIAKTALSQVDTWIQIFAQNEGPRNVYIQTLEQGLAVRFSRPVLFHSIGVMVGVCLRKNQMDSATKSVHTKWNTQILLQDMIEASEALQASLLKPKPKTFLT